MIGCGGVASLGPGQIPAELCFRRLANAARTFWGWLCWPRGKRGDSNNSSKAWYLAMLPLVRQKSVWRLQIDSMSGADSKFKAL